MAKGLRLSKQNYCTHCENRERYNSKTYCLKYDTSIDKATEYCELLIPFDKFREYKENGESVAAYKKG